MSLSHRLNVQVANNTGWQDYNANVQITPLRQYDNLEVKDWFGHGYTHLPPAAGDFLELPAGGDLTGASSAPTLGDVRPC